MKKTRLILMLALALCLAVVSGLVVADGPAKGFKYDVNADGTATITEYVGNKETVGIPSELNGHPVSCIGDNAFRNCNFLTAVIIPDSVTDIGYMAFSWCPYLSDVTIPDSVTIIGYGAFYNCNSLMEICIPDSVTGIGDWAFASCVRLTSVTIPNSVISIGEKVFDGCRSLTSLTIPSSVTSIGDYAFGNNSKQTILVTEGSYAEQYCIDWDLHYEYTESSFTVAE